MGSYVYRISAKKVKCSDGKKANVAVYAYKPYYAYWDSEKANRKMHVRSGCVASEAMAKRGNMLDRFVYLGTVYANPNHRPTFVDDYLEDSKTMVPIEGVTYDG